MLSIRHRPSRCDISTISIFFHPSAINLLEHKDGDVDLHHELDTFSFGWSIRILGCGEGKKNSSIQHGFRQDSQNGGQGQGYVLKLR
jgi:hypothetical protein